MLPSEGLREPPAHQERAQYCSRHLPLGLTTWIKSKKRKNEEGEGVRERLRAERRESQLVSSLRQVWCCWASS